MCILDLSLGGAVATALAERSDAVDALVLLAPAGFVSVRLAGLFALPGVSTVAEAALPFGLIIPLVVTIPPVGGAATANPDGIVWNPSPAQFVISANGKSAGAVFIFDGEDGTITAWNPVVDPITPVNGVGRSTATLVLDNSATAVYKGLAYGTNVHGNFIFATNFRAATVEAIDAACRDHGFFYITGHGVDPALWAELNAAARTFFALDAPVKAEIAMDRGGSAWRGWFPVGAELTAGAPDAKEGSKLDAIAILRERGDLEARALLSALPANQPETVQRAVVGTRRPLDQRALQGVARSARPEGVGALVDRHRHVLAQLAAAQGSDGAVHGVPPTPRGFAVQDFSRAGQQLAERFDFALHLEQQQ